MTESGAHETGASSPGIVTGAVTKSGTAIAGNAGLTFAGSVMGAGFTMANEMFAAHFLGIEAYGSYGLALMLAKIGEIIASFGLPLSVMHFLPVHLSSSQPRLAMGVVVGSFLLPLTVAVTLALVGCLWHEEIAVHIFKLPQSSRYIAVVAMAIPLTVIAELCGSVARACGQFLPFIVIRNLVPPLCYMPVLVYLSVSSGPKIGAPYGYTAATLIAALIGLVWVYRLIRTRIGLVRPVLKLKSLYYFATPIALNSMVSIVFLWVDLFLLATLTDGKTVGIYRGCTQIVLTFDLILTACSVATAPVYAVAKAKGLQHQLQETLIAATRIATMLAAPLMLVILVNGSDILGLLGPDFRAGATALSILAVGQFVKVMFGSSSIALIICGRQSIEMLNTAMAAVLNLVLNLLLIPRLGLLGAAVATGSSMLVLSGLRVFQLRMLLGLHMRDLMLIRILAIVAPLAAAVALVSAAGGWGQDTGVLHLAFRLFAMGVLILGGAWMFCLRKNDRAALIQTITRRTPVRASVMPGS